MFSIRLHVETALGEAPRPQLLLPLAFPGLQSQPSARDVLQGSLQDVLQVQRSGAWCQAKKGHIWAEPRTTMPMASGSPGRELLEWPWYWIWLSQPPGLSSAIPELVVAPAL